MTDPTITASEAAAAIRKSVRDHWGLFLFEGALFVILGLLAILVPQVATLATTPGTRRAFGGRCSRPYCRWPSVWFYWHRRSPVCCP
jgi:hypothetical protein